MAGTPAPVAALLPCPPCGCGSLIALVKCEDVISGVELDLLLLYEFGETAHALLADVVFGSTTTVRNSSKSSITANVGFAPERMTGDAGRRLAVGCRRGVPGQDIELGGIAIDCWLYRWLKMLAFVLLGEADAEVLEIGRAHV